MGKVKLSEMQDELLSTIGRDVSPARLTLWLNQAYRELAYAFKFRELEGEATINTVAGTKSYAFPAADFRMLSEDGVWIVGPDEHSPKEVLPETRRTYIRNADLFSADARGVPDRFHIHGQSVFFRPIPDEVYDIEVNYWKRINDLSLPDDTIVLSEDWDEAVLLGGVYRGYRSFGEHDRYQNLKNDQLALVRSRVLEVDVEPFPEGGIDIAREETDL